MRAQRQNLQRSQSNVGLISRNQSPFRSRQNFSLDLPFYRTQNACSPSITIALVSTQDSFGPIRAKAAQGQLVIVRPDGQFLLLPALRKENIKADMVAGVERMLPSTTKRNVAVIADMTWTGGEAPSLQTANQAIPFFGMLLGFACIGHSVWIFDGSADVFESGCREADVLIVDTTRIAALTSDWQPKAARVMRYPQILLHDRATYQLRKP